MGKFSIVELIPGQSIKIIFVTGIEVSVVLERVVFDPSTGNWQFMAASMDQPIRFEGSTGELTIKNGLTDIDRLFVYTQVNGGNQCA
jgi:hypothetical protein